MAGKDAWDIAVDVAQILAAIGTCAAVVVSLWLASAGRIPKARIVLAPRNQMFQSANPDAARLEVVNTGDQSIYISRVHWRMGRVMKSHWMSWERYADDEDQGDIYGVELRHGVPLILLVPYRINVRHIRELIGASEKISENDLKRLRIEVTFSTGHVQRTRVAPEVAREIAMVSAADASS